MPCSDMPAALDVVTGVEVANVLAHHRKQIVDLVAEAYALFGRSQAANPDSNFLVFPENTKSRIIALPAYLGGNGHHVAGIKWISSFPDNLKIGLRRASAVVILNNAANGYPYACLEGSAISAARTAASAAIGAEFINNGSRSIDQLGVIGTGVIASQILEYLSALAWSVGSISLFDAERDHADRFGDFARERFSCDVSVADNVEAVVRGSDMIVFTTTAATPYILEPSLFAHGPRVLNISLRDLGPDIVVSADNVVDDTSHCLRANTSPHLAAMKTGNHTFIKANIYELITGTVSIQFPRNRTAIFSPFGMGVLDLAVASFVYERAKEAGQVVTVPHFFVN